MVDGSPTRDFLYVEDAAGGNISASERYDDIKPVNLGSGQEISIKELVNIIAKLMHYKGTIEWVTSKLNGQPRRCVDIKRATGRSKKTIDWFNSKYLD